MKNIFSLLFCLLIFGCSLPRPLPEADVKYSLFDNPIEESKYNIAIYNRISSKAPNEDFNFLVLSGGGADGAWGVGVLNGWKEKGIPQFDVVIGTSTGALIAPFAFLGRSEDFNSLVKYYSTTKNSDVSRFNLLFIFNDSISSTRPLQLQLKNIITNDFIDLIAKEANKNRKLFVTSCCLDDGNAEVWDLTEIAASDDVNKYDRFRNTLLASAAVPIFFPPVFLDGHMQVDGGVKENVYFDERLFPQTIYMQNKNPVKLYVIVNGGFDANDQAVDNSTIGIAARSIQQFMLTKRHGELQKIESIAKRLCIEFYLCYAPEGTPLSGMEFDPAVMTELIKLGREWGLKQEWLRTSPIETLRR